MKSITLFVLGHEKEQIKNTINKIQSNDHVKIVPVNLSELSLEKYNDNSLCEGRFFLCDWKIDTTYVGVITASWAKKYSQGGMNVVPIKSLMRRIIYKLSPNVIIGPDKVYDWIEKSEKDHPGLKNIIIEVSKHMEYDINSFGCSLLANNFFCHRNVFKTLTEEWRKMFAYLTNKYELNFPFEVGIYDNNRKPAYLLERLTMIYLSSYEIEDMSSLCPKMI